MEQLWNKNSEEKTDFLLSLVRNPPPPPSGHGKSPPLNLCHYFSAWQVKALPVLATRGGWKSNHYSNDSKLLLLFYMFYTL
jgi:hypothetical protein